MKTRLALVAVLLFFSGMSGLVLQVAWLREFRLVFGCSTAASAAVLAVFLGGLGLGNAWLGQRVDRHEKPLRMLSWLLFWVALSAAPSPFLLDLISAIYFWTGGQTTLGGLTATVVRLALSWVVLCVPTVCMGGTLPAAIKSVTLPQDSRRRGAGLLYGSNTLGAVAGAVLSTFVLLEACGERKTLWLACLLDLGAALGAWRLSVVAARPRSERHRGKPYAAEPREIAEEDLSETISPGLAYAVAGFAGFAFFLMELVWYRMLAPILGGTTYTFGLILAVALLGIGVGGAAYSLVFRHVKPDLKSLGLTIALEALAVALPFALGDRLAILAAALRETSSGFSDAVLGWTAVAGIVVLPAALVSGIQFPLLVALAGRGEKDLGCQVGLVFAWNTVGAILGSLAGGFGLLPLLTAPGAWRAVVLLLSLMGVFVLAVSYRRDRIRASLLVSLGGIVAALALSRATGPTAVWRHGAIGAGGVELPANRSPNEMQDWANTIRRAIVWEAEGVEASVALAVSDSLSFVVNGKADGNALADAPTQIMLGILGAILAPNPRSSAVIGLGTGETAGWLAALPSMQQVCVIELEPAIDEVARRCAAVNHDVLHHPKVRRIYNDAREVLLTTSERYDLIVSEPSNPYRAGVAALYTREFYRAVRRRLSQDGLFVQWLQQYDVDLASVAGVLATLRSEFIHVEIWEAEPGDMLLVCSTKPIAYDVPRLRQTIAEEPIRSALAIAWRAVDLEAVLARHVAGPGLAHALARQPIGPLNTDDRNWLEYGFARTLGGSVVSSSALRAAAEKVGAGRMPLPEGAMDWDRVEGHRQVIAALGGLPNPLPPDATGPQKTRAQVLQRLAQSDLRGAAEIFAAQPYELLWPSEAAALATAYAQLGDERAARWIEQLRSFQPAEAEAIAAMLSCQRGESAAAVRALEKVFAVSRTDPWALGPAASIALDAALRLVKQDGSLARGLHEAIAQPFPLHAAEDARRSAAYQIAALLDPSRLARSIEAFEPHVPWQDSFLRHRLAAYRATGHRLSARAEKDVQKYVRGE